MRARKRWHLGLVGEGGSDEPTGKKAMAFGSIDLMRRNRRRRPEVWCFRKSIQARTGGRSDGWAAGGMGVKSALVRATSGNPAGSQKLSVSTPDKYTLPPRRIVKRKGGSSEVLAS